jgi:hypothetical protein
MRRISLLAATALVAGCGTDVSGPAASLYSCVFAEPTNLAVGEAVAYRGTASRELCLLGAEGGAEFVYVPFFALATDESSGEPNVRLALEILGAGVAGGTTSAGLIAADAGVPDPVLGLEGAPRPGPELRLDHDFHRRLRQREIAELEPKIRPTPGVWAPGTGEAALTAPPLADAQMGDLMDFNVALSCTSADIRTGRVEHVSDHAVVVADVGNPSGLTAQDYAYFALTFDTLVHPLAVRHFGEPSDIDGNGRTIIFFTRAVNELTPRGSDTFIAGLFWAGDLFPAQSTPRLEACPQGNRAEMFYVASPDPNAVISSAVSVAWLRDRVPQLLVHEYQHLINAARRLYVDEAPRFERTWLNEGLSHIAEELLFYEVTGLEPKENITVAVLQATPGGVTAFNRYMSGNFNNLTRFLQRPDTASLMGVDNLVTRGAAWSFLRYAADRRGTTDEATFFDLVNSTAAGLDNLDQVLGGVAFDWMRDWSVALYADDFVPGLAARHTQPSWNLRSIYETINEPYPLAPPVLTTGATRAVTLQPGGVGFLGFGVGEGDRATLHVESDGATPPRTLWGSFLRIR